MLKSLGIWGLQSLAFAGLGLLVGLPWHDQRWFPVALLALAILLLALGNLGRWRSLWMTMVWSGTANGLAFYWAPSMFTLGLDLEPWQGHFLYTPLLLLDVLRAGLPIFVATRCFPTSRHQWFWAASTAIAVENLIPSLFPWKMGYIQLASPWLNQSVDLLGPDAATFVLYAHVGVLAALGQWGIKRWHRSRVAIADKSAAAPSDLLSESLGRSLLGSSALRVTAANLIYGAIAIWYWRGVAEQAPSIKVALIQISVNDLEHHDLYRVESNRLAGQVDLICWPECCAGSYEESLTSLRDPAAIEAKSRDPDRGLRPWPDPHCPLLVGGKIYRGHPTKPKKQYQTALLLDKDETIAARYNKRYLMPLGEYKPVDQFWPGLSRTLGFNELITPGTEATTIALRGERFNAELGAVLCYEDMVPNATRTLTQNGANVLVSLINGAAFSNPLILEQHRLLSQQRAIECRRYHLRCSTSGETCVIAPWGEIVARVPLQSRQTLVTEVNLIDTSSWYASPGWRSWPATAFPYVLGISTLFLIWRDQRREYRAWQATRATVAESKSDQR